MADMYKGLIGLGKEIVKKSRFSNAMGLPLVFVVVIFLGGLAGLVITQKDLFFWIMFLPVIFFILSFTYLMVFKPEMLRTEEHEERMLQLASGMGEKGNEITAAVAMDTEQSNPEAVKASRVNKELGR